MKKIQITSVGGFFGLTLYMCCECVFVGRCLWLCVGDVYQL